LLTQCPNCQTTFRVTSDILRVANGQVRCGRCQTQFDALQRLIEEESFFAEPAQVESNQQIEVEEPDTQEDITLEGRHIEITGTYRVIDDPDQPQMRQEVTEEWVEIDDLDSEDVAVSSEGIEVEEDLEERDADAAAASFARGAAIPNDQIQPRGARRVVASRSWAETPAGPEQGAEDFDLIRPQQRARSTLVWRILAVPLLLLLIAQIVHHYRSELARHQTFGPTIVAMYSALGLPLMADWHLHTYEIKQWGVLSDPAHPGTLKVRASITNRARFAQPYPLLKLVLEDRWGDQVRAREFEPSEYLDPGTATDRLMQPDQPVNATINIVDPGPDAEGFRFDVCLRGRSPTPICAADVPASR
jgi:predicted Zn finger-like uncharacterized protein